MGWQVLVGGAAVELAETDLALERLRLPKERQVKPTTEEGAASNEEQPRQTHAAPIEVSIDSFAPMSATSFDHDDGIIR